MRPALAVEPLAVLSALAHRDRCTAYDAAYVSLAEALDAPLVALDAKLASASGLGSTIEVV